MIYRPPSIALRTSLFYAIGTALWILLSDQALALFVSSPQTLIALETYKGWAFVGVTALLLYIFLRRQFYDLEHYVIERKQKEETLRQSEYRFRMLFEQNNDAIFLIDLERVVLMANQRAAEMFGYRLNEFIGMNIQQLVAPETREQTHNVMNRLLAREKIPVYERQFIKKDGTRFLAEVNVDMVRDLQGKPLHIQSILRDITRRKQAEEMVRRRAEELNALQATLLDVTSPQPLPALLHLIVERAANLLRSSSGGLYVTEPEYHRVRCVVSYKTKRDYTGTMLDYGVGAAGHVAQSGEPLIIDDYVTWSGRAQMFEDDQPFQSVMSAPLLWQGSVSGVIHILRENTFEKFTQEELDLLVLFANHAAVAVENARLYDALDTELSERVQAEAASQQSQAQLAGIVTSAMDAIISINAEQRIVLFNPAAETVFRCAAAEAIGQPLEKFVPERFRASHAQHVRDFASSGITNRSMGDLRVIVGLRSDGVEFPADASVSQIHLASGDLYTVILRDITERVQAEEKLRESEERYRQLFENSPIGIYRTTPDGRIIASNPALVGMLGFSSFEELAARNLEHDSSDAAYSRRFFKEQIERDDHITGLESVWRKRDGAPIFIRENAHTIRDETGAVLYYDGTIEDITERKRVDGLLQKQTELYESLLLAQSKVGEGFIVSGKTGFTYVNEAFCRMSGYTLGELLSLPSFMELVALEERAAIGERLRQHLSGESASAHYETAIRHKNGQRVEVEVSTQSLSLDDPMRVIVIVRDITERVRAEETLRQTHQLLETVFDNTHLMFAYLDPQFNFVQVNRAYAKADQREPSFFPGRNHFDLYPNEENKVIFQRVVDSGQPHFSFAKPFEYAENLERGVSHWDWSLTPIKDAGGKIVGLILSLLNVTERVQAEARLRRFWDLPLIGMAITSTDRRFLEVNQKFADMMGYTVNEFAGTPWPDVTHPDDVAENTRLLQETLDGKTDGYAMEKRFIRRDGTILHAHIAVRCTRTADGTVDHLAFVIQDITERKQHERERDLLDKVRATLARELDLSTVLRTVVEAVAETFGYALVSLYLLRGEMLVLQHQIGYAEVFNEIPVTQGITGRVVRTGQPVLVEDVRTEPTFLGAIEGIVSEVCVPLFDQSQVVGTLNVESTRGVKLSKADLNLMIALSEHIGLAVGRARLYTQMRESEERFRNLVEATTDWIWEIDDHGVYTFASPKIRDILGYESAEIIGKSPADLMPPDEAKRVTAIFLPILRARNPFSNLENINRHKDGHLVALETSGIPIVDKDGKYCGYRGIDRDITERKRAEESERQHNRQINLLYEGSQLLNRTLDLGELYRTVLEFISSIVSCDSLVISAFDADTQMITCRAMWVDGKQQEVGELPPIPLEPRGHGTQSVAIRMAHSLLFNDYQARVKTAQTSHYVSDEGLVVDEVPPEADIPRSAMIVPLMLANQVVGVIQVFSYQLNAYTDNQLKILESLASHIASAQQNALLYTERVRAEQQVAASEAKMRALFSAMRDVVLTIDQDGIYREIAPTNPGLLIRPPHELLGKTLADVFLPLQAEELLGATRQVLATQQVKYVEYDLTISGKQVWFSTAITPMSTDATVWVARDITERKLAETRIQLQIDRLSALRVIDQAISSSFDLRVTLSILLNQVMSQLHADAAAILMLNPQLQTLQYSAGSGFRTKAAERVQLHLGDSYAGRAVLERQMISASQSAAGHDSRFAALKTAEGFTTYFCLPLITKGNVVGVLEIFYRALFESDFEWLSFLEMLAAQAAIAIDNANLFQNLQRSNIDLMLAYDTTLEGWSRALDLRDKETEGHSQRVTALTLQLARALELSEEAIIHIRRGALLHDIGKMGVPDSILLKPDKLTDDEWESMHRHPQLAVDLLSPIPYLRPALDIPYCHHEKWDGTGYPRGLQGEQIPLAARIFAIADVWDALRSDRPYRPGWSAHKTRDYIKSLSGTHLDPKVVEVFLTQLQL